MLRRPARDLTRTFTRTFASSSSSAPRVSIERAADGVATVTLGRPEKLNSLDIDMFRAIRSAAVELAEDKGVRAVVVHGSGRAFCAGLDVKSINNPLHARANGRELLDRPDGAISNLAQDVCYLWRRVPAPVIAATHGVCLGGGFQIALGADMRIATPGCKFSLMEAKWGIIPDMGATVVLPELVPKDVATELIMTGRTCCRRGAADIFSPRRLAALCFRRIFDGEEALQLGLVTRLAEEPLAEARRLASEIAARSPDSTAAVKRLLDATYCEADDRRKLHLETALQRRLLGGWNQLASAARGLGAPPLLQPSFAARSDEWLAEADAEAEAEVRAMLDGGEVEVRGDEVSEACA
mmetsp:Transcript_2991/g.10340  ORF Transcript_2991/g.10340 Transcript_2991/m.10340 type:complete len:354 (-) Transcript_2991:255-1316(-)